MEKIYFHGHCYGLSKTTRIWVMLLIFSVLNAINAKAQVSPQTLITLQVKEKTIPEVLTILNKKIKLKFMYNPHDFGNSAKVSFNLRNQPLKQVLDVLFKGAEVNWTIENGVLLIKKIVASSIQHQTVTITISGTLTDEQGKPIAMATVADMATNRKTSTNQDGVFNIEADASSTLTFSCLGMKTLTVSVYGRTQINEVLHVDSKQLEEVVINTGYGRVNASELTGAVTHIDFEDINTPGLNTVDKMLEGHVPGMIFMQNSGQVGASPKIQIRGSSTILGTQEPLWVIDGIVQQDPVNIDPQQLNSLDAVNLLGNAVSGLNPDDIQSIDVLKDAAATAIYGVRAANGVIVITTKRGKKGPPVISYSLSGTLSTRPRYTDANVNVMNSFDRTNLSRQLIDQGISYPRVSDWVGYESAYQDYYNKKINFSQFQQQVGRYETVNTDWFGLLMHDAVSNKHTLSLSGGDGNVNYYTSIGYNGSNGVINGEYANQYTMLSKLSANYKRFTVDVELQANQQKKQNDVNDAANYAFTTSRVIPAYNTDGSLYYYNRSSGYNGNTLYPFNMLNEENNSNAKSNVDGIALNSTINYNIDDALKFGVTLGYQIDNSLQDTWHGYNSYYATLLRQPQPDGTISVNSEMPFGDELQENNQRRVAYTVRPQFDFNKYLDKALKHQLIATVGAELSSNKYVGKAQTYRGYLPDRGEQMASFDITQYQSYIGFLEKPAALGVRTDELTNLASAYASATYNYDNRYLFNANARIDGSNKFGSQSNGKLNPIWSVSARWNIKEDVMQNVSWVNALNVRGSFGYQGDIVDSQTPELIIQRSNITTPSGEYYSTVQSFPNPYLQWEKTASYNAQVDFSLFDNKIQGTIAYFYKHTSDAYIQKNVSDINGVTSYFVNSGTLNNHGIEVSLNFTPINKLTKTNGQIKGFRWSFDPELGSVINQFINKAFSNSYNSLKTDYKYQDYIDGNIPVNGKALGTIYSYQFAGLNHNNGIPMFNNTDISQQALYNTLSNEQVWAMVLAPTGTRVPTLQGGIMNNFQYNRFYLSLNLNYSLGSKIRLAPLYPDLDVSQGTNGPLPVQNANNQLLNRWRNPGDETKTNIPAIVGGDLFNSTTNLWWAASTYSYGSTLWQMYDQSDIRVVSGNYLKLQSFSFRYQLADELVKKIAFKSAYVGLTGTNLFVWSAKELHGQDPATATGTGPIPLSLRPTYSFTLNVSF